MNSRRSSLQMLTSRNMTENLTLVKANGQEIPNINAYVQPEQIHIEDGNLPIEEGDTLRRVLKNGLIEEYLVLDRGYYSGGNLVSSHYQSKVRKKTAITHPAPVNNNYAVNGDNSRINIGSSDYSTNTVNAGDVSLFTGLRKAIETHVKDESQRTLILERVTEMEATQQTPDFTAKYQAFIQQAANHMIVVTSFIPALSQLLLSH